VNSLNRISATLTETALLLTLLPCKDKYYMHYCLLYFTETNKLWILLKTRPNKEEKRPVTDVLWYSSWA